MTRQMTLQELYDKYLQEFKKYKRRPNLSLLLTLLLLIDKDKHQKTCGTYLDFYEKNGSEFYAKAYKIMKDFNITVEELRRQYEIRASFLDDKWVVRYVFGSAVDTLMRAWQLSSQYSSEELYDKLCHLEGGEPLPQIRDNEIPYSKLSPLQRKYRQYLNRFNRDKKGMPHPAKLLALLILDDKERYISLCEEGNEEDRKAYIDDKIKQLMTDFELTEMSLFMAYPTKYGQVNVQEKVGILYNPKIKENVFGKALTIILGELSFSPTSSSEILYNKFCDMFRKDNVKLNMLADYFMEPQVRYNPETMMYQYPKLDDLYAYYLNIFEKTGKRPRPSELLALLLLPKKDNFYPAYMCSGEFYNEHKQAIDDGIKKVCEDFNITKQEIINYIEATGLVSEEEKYEHDKIWQVFNSGFGVVQWANMYHDDWSPEKLHSSFSSHWGREPIPDELIEEQPTPNISNKTRRRIKSIPTTGFKF